GGVLRLRPMPAVPGLVLCVPAPVPELIPHLGQVVAGRRLQGRERLERLEPREPELLADGQQVPVVEECGRRSGQRTPDAHGALLAQTNGLLEGVTLDVLHERAAERPARQDPPPPPPLP